MPQTSATLILVDNIFSNSFGDIVFSGIIANKSISDYQIIFSSFDSLTSSKLKTHPPQLNLLTMMHSKWKSKIKFTAY